MSVFVCVCRVFVSFIKFFTSESHSPFSLSLPLTLTHSTSRYMCSVVYPSLIARSYRCSDMCACVCVCVRVRLRRCSSTFPSVSPSVCPSVYMYVSAFSFSPVYTPFFLSLLGRFHPVGYFWTTNAKNHGCVEKKKPRFPRTRKRTGAILASRKPSSQEFFVPVLSAPSHPPEPGRRRIRTNELSSNWPGAWSRARQSL